MNPKRNVSCKRCRTVLVETWGEHACSSVLEITEKTKNIEMDKGKEGRLHCHKCTAQLGRFKWYGCKCICGAWIVPYIAVHKRAVDIMDSEY